ncbi:hypothetical protein [Streptomyces sp. AA1529]|uniref:hypothetical protein n=1 Tax=Streptomyces sp. AA1529 TaxID=1203257 RepID=UPI003D70E358
MAYADFNAPFSASAHPMAKPGFGKRTPDSAQPEGPSSRADFAHLPERAACLASFIDRLPEGAAIDVKTLAKSQPRYGQQACRSALRELSRAGHLRRVGGLVGEGCPQHVTRTYFSRAARDEDWWTAFLDGRVSSAADQRPVPGPAPDPGRVPGPVSGPAPDPAPVPVPVTAPDVSPAPEPPRRTEAYRALAALGRRDPRLVLSAAECAELAAPAAEWLARDTDAERFASALTAGLPPVVHSPAGLVRSRLTAKLPPVPAATGRRAPVRLRPECTDCGRPGSPESLRGGLCRACRAEPAPPRDGLPGEDVRRWAALVRGGLAAARPPIRPRPARPRPTRFAAGHDA